MLRRRRPDQPAITLSFIDMVSGGMAASLLLFLSVAAVSGSAGGIGPTRAHGRGDDARASSGRAYARLAVIEMKVRGEVAPGDLSVRPAEGVEAFRTPGSEGTTMLTVVVTAQEPVTIYLRNGVTVEGIETRTCGAEGCGRPIPRTLLATDAGQAVMTFDPLEVQP